MNNNRNNRRIIAASVTGTYHLAKNQMCQDCFGHISCNNKMVAVVSDGAGSAKYGKIGAKTVCRTVCDILINSNFNNVEQNIIKALEVSRQKLALHRFNKYKSEKYLTDFSATVVGCFCEGKRGVFFHIGDGAGIALCEKSLRTVISQPENGISSCETYFYTMDDWKDSLRFTHFENAQSLMLMTDGVTGFAFRKDFADLEKKFIEPINNFLLQEASKTKAVNALTNTLSSPQACKINPDDKTLLWARLK